MGYILMPDVTKSLQPVTDSDPLLAARTADVSAERRSLKPVGTPPWRRSGASQRLSQLRSVNGNSRHGRDSARPAPPGLAWAGCSSRKPVRSILVRPPCVVGVSQSSRGHDGSGGTLLPS